ncbi:unnamed protein product [Camellia sinensis]
MNLCLQVQTLRRYSTSTLCCRLQRRIPTAGVGLRKPNRISVAIVLPSRHGSKRGDVLPGSGSEREWPHRRQRAPEGHLRKREKKETLHRNFL